MADLIVAKGRVGDLAKFECCCYCDDTLLVTSSIESSTQDMAQICLTYATSRSAQVTRIAIGMHLLRVVTLLDLHGLICPSERIVHSDGNREVQGWNTNRSRYMPGADQRVILIVYIY